MRTLLQIDVCLNWGSTGRISEGIAKAALARGWDCYMLHGSRYNRRGSVMKDYQPGSVFDEYCHYAEHRFLDNDGLASRKVTRKAVEYIKELKPDLIQIHTIHDHWLNFRILFEYLNTLDIPIVWTQHDCWCFTGGCSHFTLQNCYLWRDGGCKNDCPQKKPLLGKWVENTKKQYELRRNLFTSTRNLTIVPVSYWLEGMVRQSFLKYNKIKTICNGVDTDVFHPFCDNNVLKKYGLTEFKYVVAAATAWSVRKGFDDYIRLSSLLKDNLRIVLVGLEGKFADVAREHGIIALSRTDNQLELAAIYSSSEVVLNLSYEETFGLTSAEGFACGRPTIVYNCTASPELVGDSNVGYIVKPGDVEAVATAIYKLKAENQVNLSELCRNRALSLYDKNKRFVDYVDLYSKLVM